MTQVVKTDKNESTESIRKRLEKIGDRKVPEFWKKMFTGKNDGKA
jgi:NADPH-dependent curcumin reductase CurA